MNQPASHNCLTTLLSSSPKTNKTNFMYTTRKRLPPSLRGAARFIPVMYPYFELQIPIFS
jgi:hypothetical protein